MALYRFDEIAVNSTEKKKPVEADKNHYIGLEHLDPKSLIVRRYGTDVAPIGEKLIMKKGDVLFGKRRAYQKKVAISPIDGIFSAHGMVLRPKENVVDKDFFPLFVSSDYFLDAAIGISVGSLSPTINWSDLANLKFELPDLPTQKKAAHILWSVQDAIEAYKNLSGTFDEMVSARFVEVIERGEFSKVPLKRILQQNNKTERIEDTTSEKYVTVALYGKGVRQRDIGNDEPSKFTGYRVKEGQFIYSRIDARNGAFGTIPNELDGAVVTKDFPVFDINDEQILPLFLLFTIQQPNFIRQIQDSSYGTTNRQRIKEDVFLNYSITLPPLDVQNGFVDFYEYAQMTKSSLDDSIEELEHLYRCIISEYLG